MTKVLKIVALVFLLIGCSALSSVNSIDINDDAKKESNNHNVLLTLPLSYNSSGNPNEIKTIFEKAGFKVKMETLELNQKNSSYKENDIYSINATDTISGNVVSTFNRGDKISSDYEIVITYFVNSLKNDVQTKNDFTNSFFEITFIDVGQGDAILINCDNHYALVDGGPTSKSSLIYTLLKNKNISHLDYIFCTHPDSDHVGGLSGALNYASLGSAYCPCSEDTESYIDFVKNVKKHNVEIEIPNIGDVFDLGSSSINVLASNIDSDNNASLVLKVLFGNTRFLLMGDANTQVEEYLINNEVDIKCDLLKVGHHGSKYSTGQQFLYLSDPKYAIISVGADNTYGHPSEETLSNLKNADVITYRTDLQGDIVCKSDGKELIITAEKNIKVNTLEIVEENNSGYKETKTLNSEYKYCINVNSKKFHYSWCSSVGDMKEENKKYTNEDRELIVTEGYVPCKRCNP